MAMKSKKQHGSRMIKNARIIEELKQLAADNDGLLTPGAVVEAARAPKSALHSSFTWDNSTAAHEYRLWQARQLLRVTVEYLPSVKRDVRVFVSLTPDREQDDGGYRTTVDVLMEKDHRSQLLTDALAELAYFQKKYEMLTELAGVWREIRKLMDK